MARNHKNEIILNQVTKIGLKVSCDQNTTNTETIKKIILDLWCDRRKRTLAEMRLYSKSNIYDGAFFGSPAPQVLTPVSQDMPIRFFCRNLGLIKTIKVTQSTFCGKSLLCSK